MSSETCAVKTDRVHGTGRVRLTTLVFLLVLSYLAGCAAVQDLRLEDIGLGGARPLDESTVTAGLKEALRVGTERSVDSTSQTDGFWGNALIRIALPDELDSMTGTLRDVGFGSLVDDFELGMNRAAEAAAGEAVDVFWEAVQQMSIADAFGILDGGPHAATQYFRVRTSEALTNRFRPIVENRMEEVGAYPLYRQLHDRYTQIPLVEKPDLDLIGYVTDRTLSGLFQVLAGEEQRIRNDPIARTTELLRRVFGRNS